MTVAMFAAMRRLGVVLALTGLALAAGSGSAWASSTLSKGQVNDLRLYDSTLVLARPGAGPALRRAGGVKLAHALPVWRVPSGAAVRALPALMRAGLVPEVAPDHPL